MKHSFSLFSWLHKAFNCLQLKSSTEVCIESSSVFDSDEIFSTKRGARPNMKRVLIVITDGESQDVEYLPGAAQSAEEKKIVRFAIGVSFTISTYN